MAESKGWQREAQPRDPEGCKAYISPLLLPGPPAGSSNGEFSSFSSAIATPKPGAATAAAPPPAAAAAAATQQLSPLQKKSTFINLPADICAHNFRDPAIKELLLVSAHPSPSIAVKQPPPPSQPRAGLNRLQGRIYLK